MHTLCRTQGQRYHEDNNPFVHKSMPILFYPYHDLIAIHVKVGEFAHTSSDNFKPFLLRAPWANPTIKKGSELQFSRGRSELNCLNGSNQSLLVHPLASWFRSTCGLLDPVRVPVGASWTGGAGW